ncbi:MAG: RimK family alpha-L-glutamate ligase, partial [Gemmataceae bacterium]
MTVVILGGHDDYHAVHVQQRLQQAGHDVALLDSRWFPAHMQIAYDPVRDTGVFHLPEGRKLPFQDIRSIYWRCYNSVAVPAISDPEQHYIAANDARSLFDSLLIRLPTRWVNGWNAYQLHQTKPAALALVAALGVPVPATILGNEPEAVREFASQHPNCIFKPVQGGAHTERLGPAHLTDDNLQNLAYAPVTLQEEVPGTNIRVFVAGERVLACEVRTDEIDFRNDQEAPIFPHEVPAEIGAQSIRIARALDLLWTGMDYRLTPEGCYVYLEANPSPMFVGF